MKLSKPQIKTYLQELYNVRVTQIDTAIIRGKIKANSKGKFKRPDYKKAYVTVADPIVAADAPAGAAADAAKATVL
jgi:ribosomal protein L23